MFCKYACPKHCSLKGIQKCKSLLPGYFTALFPFGLYNVGYSIAAKEVDSHSHLLNGKVPHVYSHIMTVMATLQLQ